MTAAARVLTSDGRGRLRAPRTRFAVVDPWLWLAPERQAPERRGDA